jgi:hypothetical protein
MRQRVAELNHVARVVAPMSFDGEIDVGSEFFANGFHSADDPPDVLRGQVALVQP